MEMPGSKLKTAKRFSGGCVALHVTMNLSFYIDAMKIK